VTLIRKSFKVPEGAILPNVSSFDLTSVKPSGLCYFMQVCNKCGSKNIILEDFEFTQFFGCYDCGEHGKTYGYGVCCKAENLIHIMVEQSNGSWVRKTACKNCKTVKGKAIPKGSDYHTLPHLTKEKRNEYDKNHDRISKLYYERVRRFNEELKIRNQIEWRLIYDTYIKSEKWRQKAAMVKKRDNNICQACLSAPAQAVHHLSYKNLTNEPLFELVSVCHACHSQIHNH
jgi:hypothetical protein